MPHDSAHNCSWLDFPTLSFPTVPAPPVTPVSNLQGPNEMPALYKNLSTSPSSQRSFLPIKTHDTVNICLMSPLDGLIVLLRAETKSFTSESAQLPIARLLVLYTSVSESSRGMGRSHSHLLSQASCTLCGAYPI